MSQQKGNLKRRACSDEDNTSLSDLRKLMESMKSAIQEVNGRVMKLEYSMERLLLGTTGNMTEIKAQTTGPRCLKLVFNNKISLPVLNGEEIKGEGGKYLEVALVDDVTGEVVDFGHEASAYVEIVALEGDSVCCERDTWEIGNYKNKITKAGAEKMSVLAGKMKLKLNKGIGSLVDIKFRNSSNHNSGVFKLGARVIDSFDGTLIKEAMTGSFVVKDFREKYKQKHYPPSLLDDVWRLKNIQKGGAIHNRLKEKFVKTVEDFLILLLKDSEGLKKLLGLPTQKWKGTVLHAKTCIIDQKVYCCINCQENKGVVFNVVGQILGIIKKCNYVPYRMLSEEDKVDAGKLLSTAFNHMGELKEFEDEASLLQYLSCLSANVVTNSPSTENTLSNEAETSRIGQFDQANIDASPQVVLSSTNPCRGNFCQEARPSGLDRSNVGETLPSDRPTVTAGEEGNLNGPDLEVIFPSINVPGGNESDSPIYSPLIGDQESLNDCLSWSHSKGEASNGIKASEPHGFGLQDNLGLENFLSQGVQYNVMGANCFLSSHEFSLFDPLWEDQYNVQASSSSPIYNGNWHTQGIAGQPRYSNRSCGADFIDSLEHTTKRRWNVLLTVIKWYLILKKRAAFKGKRLLKKQRIS